MTDRSAAAGGPVPSPAWHALGSDDALAALHSQPQGLAPDEAAARLARHGRNELPPPRKRSPVVRLLLQFHNVLIYVLLAAGVVTVLLGQHVDAGVIFGVVLINAIIGFVQEGKAERALEAVRAMLAATAIVLRGGQRREIAAAELVPGDIVLLAAGDRVPADLRLLREKNLQVDEATLTGDSLPVAKSTAAVAADAPLAERGGMAYSGTVVATGQAAGVVVATGTATEIGRIGALVAGVEHLATPLARKLDQFARRITAFILAGSVFTFGFGLLVHGFDAVEIFLAVVGLAVAAIPEGLPAIVTITLAIGTQAMARRHAIVRRLPAVEALGSVTVICTDKTGTLTRNEMTVVGALLPARSVEVSGVGYAPEGGFTAGGAALDPAAADDLQALARCGLLCNDAALRHVEGQWQLAGDPTEGALLTLAMKAGLDTAAERARWPRIDEVPFESEHGFMATLHHDHETGAACVFLKGAPERVLERCDRDASGAPLDLHGWHERVEAAARLGQRVLALAVRQAPAGAATVSMADLEGGFELLGLAAMIDPPRPESIDSVARCRAGGMQVKMITGDHALTAASIGRQLGLDAGQVLTGREIEALDDEALRRRLPATEVIARASPEHKLRLVAALQAQGHIVAMTGDGVNDAPALKRADIGVAMGRKGTDAAREAADIVLTDDNFASIANAVAEGRRIYDNIKKALLFILPTNGGECGVILLAVLLGIALPVTAAQILWINMVTTVALDIALAFEPAERGVMQRPPRPPAEPLITRLLLARLAYVTVLMIAAAFFVFEWELARGVSLEAARTATVNMLVIGELVYLFNCRRFVASSMNWSGLTGNRIALYVAAPLLALQLLLTYEPTLQALFRTAAIDAQAWALISALALAKFLAIEAEKAVLRRFGVVRL
jgi:magnesium-transporting ATPase (P-type)